MSAQTALMSPHRRLRTLRAGDSGAWAELVAEQHGRIYNLLLRLTGDREAAADLTQEAFVAAYSSAAAYRGQASPGTWLCAIALNCLRNRRRGAASAEPLADIPDDLPDPNPSVEDLALLHARDGLVREAVERLPEPYRSTVALHYLADVPSTEIAAQEGVADGTVRWRLHKALKQLWVLLRTDLPKEETR